MNLNVDVINKKRQLLVIIRLCSHRQVGLASAKSVGPFKMDFCVNTLPACVGCLCRRDFPSFPRPSLAPSGFPSCLLSHSCSGPSMIWSSADLLFFFLFLFRRPLRIAAMLSSLIY